MAAANLLALLDDIVVVLDDAALLAKIATKKSAGVLGDDLALNAQQVTGVSVERELPVVWAVAKGSLKNKLVLVPAALALSALAPWAVTPLLVLGGLFLCYEGFEKVAHKFLGDATADDAHAAVLHAALVDPKGDLVAIEREKIAGAIRTDFILSAEIVAIALGAVREAPFVTRLAALSAVSLAVTVGVYGLVAAVVKLDDLGLSLRRRSGLLAAAGEAIIFASPWLMKALSFFGTLAMFLVGGGIMVHAVHGPEGALPALIAGFLAGGACLAAVKIVAGVLKRRRL